MENDRRRRQRNRIWLALLLLGVVIQVNLLFNESPPVQSAAALLQSVSDETVPDAQNKQQSTETSQQSNPEKKSDLAEPAKSAQTPAPLSPSPDVPAVGKMIAQIPRSKPSVYLTFDDGPSKYTKDIVAILEKNHVKGGFFWIGQELKTEEQSAFARQMLANGHVIGTHTMHHEKLQKKPKDVQIQIIRTSTQYISQKIGSRIHYFRPPYGAVDENTLLASKETNQVLAYWNVDSLDWKHGDKPDLIMKNIASEVKPGSIILMHEKEHTVQLLPKIIELLKNKGYGIEPLPTPEQAKKS